MLKELFDRVVGMAQANLKHDILRPPAEPEHVYLVAAPDGSLSRHEAEPPPRRHEARSLATVVDFVQEFHGGEAGQKVAVWFDRGGVTALLDDDTRRDRVTMPLTLTAPMQVLKGLNPQTDFEQKALIRLLRMQLGDCLPDGSFLACVRKLKFRSTQDGQSVVEVGKSSIGRTLEAEVSGAGTFPEEVTLYPQVWNELNVRSAVRCVVDAEPTNQRFQLVPAPGEIERALRHAEDELRDMIGRLLDDAGLAAGDDAVVPYYGRP